MRLFKQLWRKVTHSEALNQSSGYFETQFFESVYRFTYIAGLSAVDNGLYCLYRFTVQSMIIIFVLSELWYLFSESSNMEKIIDNINVTLIHLIAMYRYRNMMTHKYVYKRLAAAMESSNFDISTPNRKKILKFWINRSEIYLKVLLGLGTCTLAAWYMYPLVDDIDYNLTVAVRLPFDYKNSRLYSITYLFTMAMFNYTSYFVMINDLIMQVHMMHLLCQFEVLADCFRNILKDCYFDGDSTKAKQNNDNFKDIYVYRLKRLVDQHIFVINNTLKLKEILSNPMLGQFLASSMLICFAGYQVTVTIKASLSKFLMSLLYLGYNMFELYIFCRWCDEIKIQSEYIADAVYSSGWECGAASLPGVRARLMIVIARARKPLVLTAGGLYDLSLASYGTLVKTSYSALTVLLRVNDD